MICVFFLFQPNLELPQKRLQLGLVLYIFNPSTKEAEADDFGEFKASLNYMIPWLKIGVGVGMVCVCVCFIF